MTYFFLPAQIADEIDKEEASEGDAKATEEEAAEKDAVTQEVPLPVPTAESKRTEESKILEKSESLEEKSGSLEEEAMDTEEAGHDSAEGQQQPLRRTRSSAGGQDPG